MIVNMTTGIPKDDQRVLAVSAKASQLGLKPEIRSEKGKRFGFLQVLLLDGKSQSCSVPDHIFRAMDGVESVIRVTPPRVSISHNGGDHHRIQIGGSRVGVGKPTLLVAGPCTVDQHIGKIAAGLSDLKIRNLRGGCWKPRSSPYSFAGYGERALKWLFKAAKDSCMESVFTEVIESSHIEAVRKAKRETGYYGTIVLWVGARTHNPILLRELGSQTEFPVMLKNSITAQGVDDLYERAEWVLAGNIKFSQMGEIDRKASIRAVNDKVILCLRGIKQTDPRSPWRFIPNHDWTERIREQSWAPVAIDPSHSAGTMEKDLVFKNVRSAMGFSPSLIMVEGGYPQDGFAGFKGLCDVSQSVPLERMGEVINIVKNHNQEKFHSSVF